MAAPAEAVLRLTVHHQREMAVRGGRPTATGAVAEAEMADQETNSCRVALADRAVRGPVLAAAGMLVTVVREAARAGAEAMAVA